MTYCVSCKQYVKCEIRQGQDRIPYYCELYRRPRKELSFRSRTILALAQLFGSKKEHEELSQQSPHTLYLVVNTELFDRFKSSKVEASKDALDKLELSPRDETLAADWYNKGVNLYGEGIWDEAISSFDKALEIRLCRSS